MEPNTRTLGDTNTDKLFGTDVPEELWGPAVERDAMRAGMIVRYVRPDKLGKEKKIVHVFQLPGASGSCFFLWGTAVLNNKLRAVKKGTVLLVTYGGQSEDENRTHVWTVKPFVGTPRELNALIESERWQGMFETMDVVIASASRAERSRRAALGDGAPPHDDADNRDGFANDIRG